MQNTGGSNFNNILGGAGIGSLFGGMFSNYTNPADPAMKYLNQVPDVLRQYFSPYVGAGQQAMSTLQGQYGQLLNDPTALMAKFGGSFQASPGYQYNVDQATKAANQAAAAGGMAGTPEEQQELAKQVTGLANQDYYNYLGNAMNLYGRGLTGMEGINQMGFMGAQDLATSLAQNLMSQAGLSYAGQSAQNMYNAQRGSGLGGLLGGIGGAILPFI